MEPDSDTMGALEDPKSSKKCSVCGDKALGYNFNAITCESCKAFFRRNALKNKEFNCPFNNNCEVTVITRRFCQKCRLQKCFNIGMKKESILSEEEKMQKWQKIKDNRAKKQTNRREKATGSGDSRPDSGASSPRSPGLVGASSNGNRPQARVLPSTRLTDSTDSGRGGPRRKIVKLEEDQLSSEDRENSITTSIHDESSQGLVLHSFRTAASLPTTTTSIPTTPTATTTTIFSSAGDFLASNYPEDQMTPSLNYESVASSSTDHLPSSTRPPQSMMESVASSTDHIPASTSPQNLIINQTERLPSSSYPSTSLTAFQIKSEFQLQQQHQHHHHHQQQQQQHQQQQPVGKYSQMHSNHHPDENISPSNEFMATPGHTGHLHDIVDNHQMEYLSNTPVCLPTQSNLNGCSLDNLDDVVAIAIKAEFHTTSLENGGGKELNDREKSRLEELFIASRSLVEPVELEHEECSSEPSNLISVINMTDIAIKRIIRMAKKITPFIAMCQEDQIALLKGGCTELMILRSVINYDPDKNSWRLPSKGRPRELRMDVLKEASQLGVNLYEEHQRFVQSFHPKWRADENVMLLLSAIALFTPERSNVLHKDVVKLEQDTYYYLLRRYLETVCSGCDSRSVYLNLIGKLEDLHRLNESHIQLFLEVNPKLVEPLLIEIFDLNPAYR